MDKLDSIISSGVDLEEYLNEYSNNNKFLKHYFLQDKSRIISNNYYYYGSRGLTVDDKFEIISELLKSNSNKDMINLILNELLNLYGLDDIVTNKINILVDYFEKLASEGKINIDDFKGISIIICQKNPLKMLETDLNNIVNISKVSENDLTKILDICIAKNYEFTEKCSVFLEENIYGDKDKLVYFINKCKYNSNIGFRIIGIIKKMSKEEMHELINNYQINHMTILDVMLTKLNVDNFDIKTIVKNREVYYNVTDNQEEVLAMLEQIKNTNSNVVLVMPRVDMDFIVKAEAIIGDNLKVSPMMNQDTNKYRYKNNTYKDLDNFPRYSKDYLKQSEDKLNLYASSVDDKVDKDGEIKSLSPLEKYLAAYLMTIKFAPYKEEKNGDKAYASRAVYEFINKDSDIRIVCAGYVNLLRELLYRMDIKDTVSWGVYARHEGAGHFDNHARMIIHLTDPKYNIDGIYMSDPTWDSRNLTKSEYCHVLMSHDELEIIDKSEAVTLDDLHANDYVRISEELHVEDAMQLFNKPIPKDTIVKAYLALGRYLNRNMKMLKDGEEYDPIEYQEMALKLGYSECVKEPSFDEMIRLPQAKLDEYFELFPDLKTDYIVELRDNLKKYFTNNNINLPIVITSKGVLVDINKDVPYFNDLISSGKYSFIDGKKTRLLISDYNGKSVVDSLPDIVNKLNEYQNYVEIMTSNNENNKLK